jgi:hypothetical protein
MPHPRAQRKIASISNNLLKKVYNDRFLIPASEFCEMVRESMISSGIRDVGLREAIESEDYIPNVIRNLKAKMGDAFQVDIREIAGKTFYGNHRNRFYPIFMELPNYVVDKSYLHKILPTSIASRKETQEEYGAKPEIILENIQNHFMYRDEEWFKEKKWLETRLKEEHIENMIDNWNSCCNKGSQPFGKTKSGKYFVNPDSPCLP